MKGKALRRALETQNDVVRINSDLPLIQDTTELITEQVAEGLLNRNQNNRPVNWKAVEKLADIMRRGEWQIHAQGIILDGNGNILTGQTRLWAVIYSGTSVYMRVSRGSPPESAFVIDRGRPQSARDLSSRRTDRKHSPAEASLARCVCVLNGNANPDADAIADTLTGKNSILQAVTKACRGTKKTKSVYMIMGAICSTARDERTAERTCKDVEALASQLDVSLMPYTASGCWGKGAAFGMALEKAQGIVHRKVNG